MPKWYELPTGAQPVEEQSEGGGVLDTILDVVSTPGRMTAGAVRSLQTGEPMLKRIWANRPTRWGGTQEDDFDDVLAAGGVDDSLMRRGAGLALDIVADPLNLVPVGAGVKLVGKGLQKVPGMTKAVDVVKGANFTQDLAKRFIPYQGLDKFVTRVDDLPGGPQDISFKDLRRLQQSTLEANRESTVDEVTKLFSGIGPDERYEIAKALDEGRPVMNQKLDTIRAQAAKIFDKQFNDEVAAGVMNPNARRIDYAPHLLTADAARNPTKVRALSGKDPWQVRKEVPLEIGVEKGFFEPDLFKSMSTRLVSGRRAVMNQEFFDRTLKQFGVKVGKGAPAPTGYVHPRLAEEAALKAGHKDIYVPAEIADELERMVELPKQADKITELAAGATALWKGYMTRANPGFHVRNGTTNMIQTWFGGLGNTGTKILDPAVVLAKHADAARKLADPSLIKDVGKYSGDEVRNAMKQYGIVTGTRTSFAEHLPEVAEKTSVNPFKQSFGFLKLGEKVGSAVEHTSRLALFLDQLEKGKTLEQAAMHVRKYLFDYGELTDFEKGVRNWAVPFYTWLRKNIPLQVENTLTQPDKMAMIGKTYNAIADTTADRGLEVPKSAVPEWMRDYIQLPMRTDDGALVFTDPNIPQQDLNKLVPDLQRDVLSALNPIPRIFGEVATNRQFFSERPIWDEKLGGLIEGGMNDYTRANGLAALIEKGTGLMPMAETNEKGVVEMPALVDYAMRNTPMLAPFGKAATAVTNENDESIAGVKTDLMSYLGLPTRPVTAETMARESKRSKTDNDARTKAIQRERGRLGKDRVKRLYDRYSQ